MKRALAALPFALVLAAVAWPLARAVAPESGVCEQMTPSRILEHPAFAGAYADALRSGRPGEVERVAAMVREIRSAHGCAGEVALPAAPAAPRLPPGHPPVGRRGAAPEQPLFGERGIVTI